MKLLLVATAFASTGAFGITRVGNSSIRDDVTGFGTIFPASFLDSRRFEDGSFYEIQTLPKFVVGATGPGYRNFRIQMLRLDHPQAFPDLRGRTPEEIRSFFLDHPDRVWWELRSKEDCILGFASDHGNLYQVVMTWGEGKGLVLLGEKDPDVLRAMREMIQELGLEEGACAWDPASL